MPALVQSIQWKPDAVTAGLTLGDSAAGDLINVEEISGQRSVQIAAALRAPAASPRNRRQQLGRRVFTVTNPPAASPEAARNAAEELEDDLRAFAAVSSILEWVLGDTLHTLESAALESFAVTVQGVTVRTRFAFSYGEKTSAPIEEEP